MATSTFKTPGFTWQSNSDKKESWRLDLKDLVIYIEHGTIYYSGWLIHCRDLGLDYIQSTASTKEEAAEEAIQICRERIMNFSSVLRIKQPE